MGKQQVMSDSLSTYKIRVVEKLKQADGMTLSQLYGGGGPLIHVPKRTRKEVLQSLSGAGLIVAEKVQGNMGAPATVYRVTPRGREVGHESL